MFIMHSTYFNTIHEIIFYYLIFDTMVNIYVLYNISVVSVYSDTICNIFLFIMLIIFISIGEDAKHYALAIYLLLGTEAIMYTILSITDMVKISEFVEPQYIVINIIKIIIKSLLTIVYVKRMHEYAKKLNQPDYNEL